MLPQPDTIVYIEEMENIDVIVVGGGIAGLVAANRSAQLGKRVALLEKGAEEKYLCNSRFSGGTFSICFKDIMSGEETLLKAIEERTAGYARPELATAIAQTAPIAIRWLQSEGAKFIKTNSAAFLSYKTWVLAPPPRVRPGLNWQGQGPDVLLQTLERNFTKRGGRIFRGTRALNLIMDGKRCVGVEAQSAHGHVSYRSGATVICDGGFQADADLVRENITRHPEKLRQRGAATGGGDGLRMARAAGAATAGLDCFYGHPLNIDALTNNKLWPYPYLDVLCTAGIVVDAQGRRFADEGMSGVYLANLMARLADPLSAHVIYDSAIWDGPGRGALIAPNPHIKEAGGTIHTADDLEGLASVIKVPVAALLETVAAYNAAYDSGGLAGLSPPRRGDRYKPFPIRKPPYYAMPMCAGITYTMGGIAIDQHARVIDDQGTAIPGLFAAGATTGGLEGGPTIGYVGGLTKASVLGYRAAEKIAAETGAA